MKYEFADAPVLDAAEERDLIAKAQGGDKEARRRLMEAGLPAVAQAAGWARKCHGGDMGDLIGEGMVGYSKAIDGFDLARDARLAGYAYVKALCEIRDYVRGKLHLFRPGRGTPDRRMREWSGPVVEDDGDGRFLDNIRARETHSPELPLWVHEALADLPARERYAVEASYGLDGDRKTLEMVGRDLGVGPSMASMLRSAAMAHLRASIPAPGKERPKFSKRTDCFDPKLITAHGQTRTIKEWAAHLGLTYEGLRRRKTKGGLSWPEAIFPRVKGQLRSKAS